MTARQQGSAFAPRAFVRGIVFGSIALAGLMLGTGGPAVAGDTQSEALCSRFGETSQDKWAPCPLYPNIFVTTDNAGSIGGSSDWYLKLTDDDNASAACSSDPKYQGDWIAKMGTCGQFCFDARIFEIPLAPLTVVHPSFRIIGPAGKADFVSTVPATTDTGVNPGWHHICAPVREIQPGETLPADAMGDWRFEISPGVVSNAYNPGWNALIHNVTQVLLRVDYTDQPSEVVGYDNICMTPGGCGETPKPTPPEITGCLEDAKVTVACNDDGTYTLTLDETGFTGTVITLASATPGVTVAEAEQPFAATTTWTLLGATAGQAVTLVANATAVGGGGVKGTDQCCSGEIKIVLPDCPKPIPVDVAIEKTGGTSPPVDVPWYSFTLAVTNFGAPFSGNGVISVTDVVPAGMTFTSVTANPASDWSCPAMPASAGTTVTCTYIGSGPTASNQSLGTITFVAMATGQGPFPPFENCAAVAIPSASGLVDTQSANDKDCVTVSKPVQNPIDLMVEKENLPWVGDTTGFYIWVTNVGAPITFQPGELTVEEAIPSGMTATGVTAPNWTCMPLPLVGPGTLTCTYGLAGTLATGAGLADAILLNGTVTGQGAITNCATVSAAPGVGTDANPANDKACVQFAQENTTLTLTKTCGPAVETVAGYQADCQITISASGTLPATISIVDGLQAPINVPGHENQIVSMTSAQNWSCSPIPAPAGTNASCQLPSADLAAAGGQSVINVVVQFPDAGNASESHNCVSATAVGSDGVTVATALEVCAGFAAPATTTATCDPATTRAVEGTCTCRYPRMARSSPTACTCAAGTKFIPGKGCIPQQTCRLPFIPTAEGTCGCPDNMQAVGKTCRPRAICKEPKIPIQGGTACGCRNGFQLKHGTCVREPTCRAPMVANAKGECMCPDNMVRSGNTCRKIPKLSCDKPRIPNKAGTTCICPRPLVETEKGCALPKQIFKEPRIPGDRQKHQPKDGQDRLLPKL